MSIYKESLKYHSAGRKGKIEVIPSKPVTTQHDLSLAYSPGVAEPCRMIAEKENLSYEYTSKGNLVAVISNGTAVLGLGNIGPHAAKPVMEGKAILFKKFADIDVFDIELDASDPNDVIRACQMLEPTFGGINLEDIKAPECFIIEEELKRKLKIPVFHDDQHGTAIICGAAFLNALEIIGKRIEDVKCVFVGGGAACISSAKMFLQLGVRAENLIMTDLDGVIYSGRKEGMNPYKEVFAQNTSLRTVSDALVGADAVIGLSAQGAFSVEMISRMAKDPIIFAMANPDPEVLPEDVLRVRPDAIMATGRSDYPNQVNNVLGFPFIFRGALDVQSTAINEEMKMAAVRAIAELAKEDVPENVVRAYGGKEFRFGREYLIPKPFDQRALLWVAPAVAEAAMKSGVARKKIDLKKYREWLETLLGSSYTFMRTVKRKLEEKGREKGKAARPYRLVFPEGEHPSILKAAHILAEEKIAEPVLLGDEEVIRKTIEEMDLSLDPKTVQIVQPSKSKKIQAYSELLFERRKRKGMTQLQARDLAQQNNYFGPLMVEAGDADGVLNGVSQGYPETIRPAIHSIGVLPGSKLVGVYLMIFRKRILWFADTTVNINPSSEELANIAVQTARFASQFMVDSPKIAMLSFSNFGSNNHPFAEKVRNATDLIRAHHPEWVVDGEMQADTALNPEITANSFPFNQVPGDANILIFPDLQSANIAYKLLGQLGEVETVGPILLGMNKPAYVLSQNSSVTQIVHMATLAAMDIRGRAEV